MPDNNNTTGGNPPSGPDDLHENVASLAEARNRRDKFKTSKKESKQTNKPPPANGPRWPDTNEHGTPKKTCANARVAIEALEVRCCYDEFHDRVVIESKIPRVTGADMDTVAHLLRVEMHKRFNFDPGKDHMHDALAQLALSHAIDPMRDYFDRLRWNGQARLDNWLMTYLGAPNTELNRWFGRLTLIAAVRRIRDPGCKFDQIPVLEGEEGTGKSTAVKVLAISPDNHSDQTIIGVSDQEQQELLRGVFIYEISELGGMQRAQVEAVKAFASRTHDRARPAYGRSRIDLPRRGIMIGTTNSDTYLKSNTGNRRWWPIKTGTVNLPALRRDLDQLWAEAAAAEASGASIGLPPELWEAARKLQDSRREHDPWEDELEDVPDIAIVIDGKRFVSTIGVMRKLGRTEGKATSGDEMRLRPIMRRLGWEYVRIQHNGRRQRGYTQNAAEEETEIAVEI